MLHHEVVATSTFQLIRVLCADERLHDFIVVGGTALALQIGHRRSEDIALFTQHDMDMPALNAHLSTAYGFRPDFVERNTLKGQIRGVKVDLITFPYPWIAPIVEEEGGRLASLSDIAAMKLSAISQDGTRLKDFIDVAFLSCHLCYADMIACYEHKFPHANPAIPLKAIAYFNDINFNATINLINARYQWPNIERRIHQMRQNPRKCFDELPL